MDEYEDGRDIRLEKTDDEPNQSQNRVQEERKGQWEDHRPDDLTMSSNLRMAQNRENRRNKNRPIVG